MTTASIIFVSSYSNAEATEIQGFSSSCGYPGIFWAFLVVVSSRQQVDDDLDQMVGHLLGDHL